MHILRIALVAGMMFTVILIVREITGWRSGRSTISPRQRVIRVSSGAAVILLLGLMLADSIVGVLFAPDMRGITENPRIAFAYFSAYMGIACLLVVLALLDVKEVLRTARRNRLRMQAELRGKDGREP